MRGGSFEDDFGLHAADRDSYYPVLESVGIGFRVAQVPQSKSDIDFDGDVDLHDYDLFQDVDLHAYALLQAAFTGPK